MLTRVTCSSVVSLFCCLLAPPCLSVCRATFDENIDSPMYKAPELPTPTIVEDFPDGAKALWLRALERPEADIKCKAAETMDLFEPMERVRAGLALIAAGDVGLAA